MDRCIPICWDLIPVVGTGSSGWRGSDGSSGGAIGGARRSGWKAGSRREGGEMERGSPWSHRRGRSRAGLARGGLRRGGGGGDHRRCGSSSSGHRSSSRRRCRRRRAAGKPGRGFRGGKGGRRWLSAVRRYVAMSGDDVSMFRWLTTRQFGSSGGGALVRSSLAGLGGLRRRRYVDLRTRSVALMAATVRGDADAWGGCGVREMGAQGLRGRDLYERCPRQAGAVGGA